MSKRRIREIKYAFRNGARYKVAAGVVGSELDRVRQENGVLTPSAVVDAARPEDAPLHPVFEWRDDVAAESFRTWQARKLIKAVEVIEDRDGKQAQSPVYVHVPESTPDADGDSVASGYQPVSVVVNRPDMYASALGDLTRRVRAAQEAVEMLRRAAESAPDTDQERMARIAIAVQAMQTASAAVQALH